MSHLEEWAHLIAKQLKSEAELVGSQAKSDLYDDVARDTFIRVVLDPFLPGSYAVGAGRVIDSSGNISSPQDIVIFRRDYPQFNMPGSHNVFIYESVLATIQVSSKLVRKSFFNALGQCASMGTLNPVIDPDIKRAMASKMKMQIDNQQHYVHPDPLNTGRFDLIGRPQSFIYAFTGYQTSDRQLAENLAKWIDLYHEDHDVLQMKSLPSVIATQGCFAWRNTAPFILRNRVLMGVGIDHAPLRLVILQLMHAFNRRLQNTSDGYGIKSNIAPYLAHFEPPAFSEMVGTALNPGDKKPAPIRKSGPELVATKKQTAVETQDEVLALQNRPAITAVSSAVAMPVRDASSVSSKKPETPAEQQAQSPVIPAGSDSVETDLQEPVIKDLSMPRPTQPDTTAIQPAQGASRTRPTSPLSLFNDGSEENTEDYQFNPLESPTPQADMDRVEGASASEDDRFSSILKIDKTESSDNGSKNKAGVLKTAEQTSPPAQVKDEEDSFIDTLVETAESLAQDTSKPASRKSQYVTESLI